MDSNKPDPVYSYIHLSVIMQDERTEALYTNEEQTSLY